MTLQAGTLATAEALFTPTPTNIVVTDEPVFTTDDSAVSGLPPAVFTGSCPTPEGFRLYTRQGFCISAPQDWFAYNMDGGVAISLNTTPGQAISFQPVRDGSPEDCYLTIYIATEESIENHLTQRHEAFAEQVDIAALTPIQVRLLADMALPGFTWASNDGESGGIFADVLGIRRIVHISFRGTACAQDDLESIIETLRFE